MRLTYILTFIAVMALSVSVAYAATPGGAEVSSNQDHGELLSAPNNDNVSVEAGNISQANLAANQSTFRWVGLFGNVSGNIQLADSSANVLYEWVASGNLVYASEANSITWASLADASDANVIGVLAYLNGVQSDNYTNTFNYTTPANIGSNIFTTITSDYAETQTQGSDHWRTYSVWDTTNVVFVGGVISGGTTYAGSTADYQMILPEDGEAGDTTATTYNLWLELS